jgi:hypothetical protein
MALGGCNRLARVLSKRINECTKRPPSLDLGVIQGDMSLFTDFYPVPVPQSDYLVARSGMHMHNADGTHPHGPSGQHIHDTLIGPKFRWLTPGDRVLVAWVGMEDEGQTPVVIDIVYPATRIGHDPSVAGAP